MKKYLKVVENRATQETFLEAQFCNFQMSKICKKRVHGNDKKNLP